MGTGFPEIIHLGAEHGVTGSARLVRAGGVKVLVDCGLAQGEDSVLPMSRWPVKPSEIDFVFITHAHIDHIGRLPELVKAGFQGEILTTHPTKALLGPMLEDAMGFSGMSETERADIGGRIDELTWGFEYGEDFDLKGGMTFRLRRAGHILGSCFVRLESGRGGWSVTFSGDLGARGRPILHDPDPPDPCDLLVLESTYGDTLHEDPGLRRERLRAVLSRALSDGGKVFIPAFALGRTQELIYEMDRLFSQPDAGGGGTKHSGLGKVPVFLDSPLGLELTKVYSRLRGYWDREARALLRAGDDPLDFERLYAAPKYQAHLQLLEMDGPAVIIAGSGMCSGGRIIDHLKAGLEDPRNDVVFVGYQARGTPGRAMVDYGGRPGGYVDLDGERVSIGAKIHTLSGYSAHADQRGLVEWVESMPEKPRRIKLVHGEPPARKALSHLLRGRGYTVE